MKKNTKAMDEAPKRITQNATKHLKVVLTRDELLDAGQKLADAQQRIAQLENDLASYKDQIKSQTTSAEAEAQRYGAMVREKYEFRPVQCTITKDYATERYTLHRDDTGELVEDRRMNDSELAMLPMAD